MPYCGRIVKPGPREPERIGFAKLAPMRRWALAVIFTFFLEFPVFILPAASQEEPSARNVLILKSFTNRNGFIELGPFKASVRARLSMPVNFNIEYRESTRFGDEGYRRNLPEALRHAYSKPRIDLVVVAKYRDADSCACGRGHARGGNKRRCELILGRGGRDDPSQNSAGG